MRRYISKPRLYALYGSHLVNSSLTYATQQNVNDANHLSHFSMYLLEAMLHLTPLISTGRAVP